MVGSLKGKIYEKLKIDIAKQVLTFAGKEFNDTKTLADYYVDEETTIKLSIAKQDDDQEMAAALANSKFPGAFQMKADFVFEQEKTKEEQKKMEEEVKQS